MLNILHKKVETQYIAPLQDDTPGSDDHWRDRI